MLLDGVAVHKYDHHWLHRNISIVGQEPTLYARSIRENIIYGLEGAVERRVSFGDTRLWRVADRSKKATVTRLADGARYSRVPKRR